MAAPAEVVVAGGLAERLLLEGPERLSTAELMSMVVGVPGRERETAIGAYDVLERMGSLRRLSCAAPAEVSAAGRFPLAAAARLSAALALGRRCVAERWNKGTPLTTSIEIFDRYHAILKDAKKERFLCVMLDGKNRVMREEQVSEGSLTSSLVHPREVFNPAIRESAGSLVFVHNHPSGDPEPSPEDIDITRRLTSVGEIVGIRVMDHVVVGDGCFVSFLDRGWIDP